MSCVGGVVGLMFIRGWGCRWGGEWIGSRTGGLGENEVGGYSNAMLCFSGSSSCHLSMLVLLSYSCSELEFAKLSPLTSCSLCWNRSLASLVAFAPVAECLP
jgi:hypothetical protein